MGCIYRLVCANRRKVTTEKKDGKIVSHIIEEPDDPCSRCKEQSEFEMDYGRYRILDGRVYDHMSNIEQIRSFAHNYELNKHGILVHEDINAKIARMGVKGYAEYCGIKE